MLRGAVSIEWAICAVSFIGVSISVVAVINVRLNLRSRQGNGWVSYLGTTELLRETLNLLTQVVFLSAGVVSLFLGRSDLPLDGMFFRGAVILGSALLMAKTAWSQIRYDAIRLHYATVADVLTPIEEES